MPAINVYNGTVGSGFNQIGYTLSGKVSTLNINNGQVVKAGLTSTRPAIVNTREIGGGQYGFFSGDVAEVIFYNVVLNTAQFKIVSNYLAAKYNMAISNDLYLFEVEYPNDVAGIGYDDASNLHVHAESANILGVLNPSSLDQAGDYLLFGHDGQSLTWETTELPGNDINLRKLNREWRFSHQGDVGSVTVSVDPTLIPTPTGFDYYLLWIDDDGNFSSGATAHPLVLNGGVYESNATVIPNGAYVTITAVNPQVRFAMVGSSAPESVATPSFQLLLNYPVSDAVNINYQLATPAGTATTGVDYTFTAGIASFLAGTQSLNISPISVIDDGVGIDAGDETVIFELSDPSLAGTPATHTYTIEDNDLTRIVEFQLASANGTETATPVLVTITAHTPDPFNSAQLHRRYNLRGVQRNHSRRKFCNHCRTAKYYTSEW